ncbi:hypothetical protein [Peribacillus loiseleuriae]|uniref:hypothetical protein n=1 Tax=Peribacillus loiseleuriae TaxID=1679170 RepID=UPI003D056199
MKRNITGNTVVKSIVLAGVLSIGVLAGGQASDAANNGKNSDHAQAVSVKAQASSHASQTAKSHAASSSAVLAKEDVKEVKVKADKEQMEAVQPTVGKTQTKATEVIEVKKAKENKSALNKANSQASEHASEIAKEHASLNSAVLAAHVEYGNS